MMTMLKTAKELQESLDRLLKKRSCDFARWVDDSLYTQDDNGRWYNFPTQEEYRTKTTEELYELFISERNEKRKNI